MRRSYVGALVTTSLLDTLQSTLGKDYAVERELGGGGMARVFVAEERALGRKVVIKVLPPETAGDVSIDRFKREVQLAARLQHPHIVPVLAAGEANGILYYTMPFIDGEPLRTRLTREHELPIPVAVRLLRDVADALSYAHAHDVVHRDIKPDNILLSGPHALVADFGIAKAIASARGVDGAGAASITQLGVALGTPAYMAPEQASADPHVDHRADVYAIGAVGYELLAGRPPFTGHSPQSLLAAVISEQAEPLAKIRPSIPPALASLIERCLEKRPADRPQSAADVLHELDAQVTPTGTTAGARLAVGRSRRWWPIAAVALIGAAGIGTWFFGRSVVPAQASSIAVMPFAPVSPDTALERLGRDLVVTMSANLDGVGEIRAADPLAVLGLTGGRDRTLTAGDAAALVSKLGASSFVLGTLIREGPRVRLDFALHSAESGAPALTRASVSTPLDSVSALSDSATWTLLRQIWRREQPPTPSVAAITTKSMVALRAYLEGERARADGRYPDAIAAFDRAIAADSSFWLAYWRNTTTRAWTFAAGDTVLQRFRAHLDQLPERDRALITAGRTVGTAARIEAYRRLAERFPDYWQAWEDAGDLAFHSGAMVGVSLDEARRYLDRVVMLNPRWTEAWQHLLAYAIAKHGIQSAQVDSITGVLTRLGYESASTQTYGFNELGLWRLVEQLATDSTAVTSRAADSVVNSLAHHRLTPTVAMVFATFPQFASTGARAQIAISRRVLASGVTERDEVSHRSAIEWAWASRGAFDTALALVGTRARASRDPAAATDAFRIAALAEWTGAVPGASERHWNAVLDETGSASRDARAEAQWLRGVAAFSRQDSLALRNASEALNRLSRDTLARLARDLSRSLRAHRLHLSGQRAAAADSLLAVESDIGERGATPFTTGIGRITAARWLQAEGRNADASRLMLWHEGFPASRPFLAARHMMQGLALFERARIAEATGDIEGARRFLSEFLVRFDLPMAAHRPLIDQAREALTRLSRKTG